MTTIAISATDIAWDSQSTWGGHKMFNPGNKVEVIGGVVYATAGGIESSNRAKAWHLAGAPLDKMPAKVAEDEEASWEMMVIAPNSWPILFTPTMPSGVAMCFPCCLGSGGTFAFAAMELGRSALEAVEFAAKHDIYTGGPFKNLNLEEAWATRKTTKKGKTTASSTSGARKKKPRGAQPSAKNLAGAKKKPKPMTKPKPKPKPTKRY